MTKSEKNAEYNEEILKYATEHNMIDISYVQEQMNMDREKEILIKHPYSIWYNEKEGRWYTDVPCIQSDSGKKRIKRKKREDLDDLIVKFTKEYEEVNCRNDNSQKANLTFSDLYYEFMDYKKQKVSTGTIRRMMADWKKFYIPHPELINRPFLKITKIDVDIFFNSIMNEQHLTRKAFRNMCGILKQVYEYAMDAEYTDHTPYCNRVNRKKFSPDKKASSETQVYNDEEKTLLINEMERRLVNNPQNTACLAVILDFELGTRKGETLAIAESDIVNGKIHIHRQVVESFDITDLQHIKSKGFQVVEYTKSEDGDRWLPLTRRAQEIIRRVMEINRTYGYAYKDYIFVREDRIISPDAIDAQIRRGCEYIGIPVKTMHKIRKTYASNLFHNGVNVSAVKDALGHADETTTLRYYIFNTENTEKTDSMIRKALGDTEKTNVKGTSRDLKIITFPNRKKAENLLATKSSAH